MMSKSSFLVSLTENNKRRLWVWVISALIFVLAFPVFTALMLNTITRNLSGAMDTYTNAAVWEILHSRLLDGMRGVVGPSLVMLMLIAVVALASAVQGFSYLYSRKKIDFYMGMPVKRKKRFLMIWLNGILLYVLPYFLGLVISLWIGALNGAVDKTVIYCAAVGFLVNLCTYLGIYHMAILTVMLTGNIIITGLGFFILCVYEFVVRLLINGYQELFFRYYSYYNADNSPRLSPFRMYVRFQSAFDHTNSVQAKYLIMLLAFALVLGILSYICYLKRPAEAAGKAMTFEITKPVIKVLLIVPASLLAGGIISDAVNFDPQVSMDGVGWMIFSIGLVIIIGSALIQVVYEFDIKGAIHKKRHIIVSSVIAALIFLIYRYDLFGFDGYIPKLNQIESVAFVPEYYEEIAGSAHFDEKGYYVSEADYANQYMKLTNVEEICELVGSSMEEYNKLNTGRYMEVREDDGGWWSYVTLIYRLKSGREVSRRLWVNVENDKTVQLLDNIIGSQEFKDGFFMGASDKVRRMLDEERYEISVSYGNLVYSKKLSIAETKEFLELYQKDLAQADFSSIREHVPVGVLTLSISEEILGSEYINAMGGVARATRGWDVSLNIYPFYKECITYLKAHDCYMDTHLKTEDVARIQVINSNSEIARGLQNQQEAVGDTEDPARLLELGAAKAVTDYISGIDTRVYADYTDEAELKQIVECIYPENLIVSDWDHGKTLDRDYQVIVYFKADSDITRNYGTNAYYGFLEGEIPDFIREDTVYQTK